MAKRHSEKKPTGSSSKNKRKDSREMIDTGKDKRFVRRDNKGRFSESDDAGRSLARDVRQHAKTKAKKGQGDRGDHKGRVGTSSTGPRAKNDE